MPRKARVEFPGAVYHLLDCGDRQEAIFLEDRDREVKGFLQRLGRGLHRAGNSYQLVELYGLLAGRANFRY